MSVYIGDVQTFAGVIADKPQVLKIGEETMEVFSAWEDYKECSYSKELHKEALVAEIADVIQACANLLAAVGVDDMRQPMQECYVRNRERGREYSNDGLSAESNITAQDVDANDSREKLEAEVSNFGFIMNLEGYQLDLINGWLNRQSAITERECRKPNWDYCDTCETLKDVNFECEELQEQADNQKKAAENFRDMWNKADARCSELKEEVDNLAAERDAWYKRFEKANREKCELQSRDTNQRHNNLLNRLREKGVVVSWDDSRSNYMVLLNNCDAARELKAENEGLKARIESLRAKLSKMLDAASAIQHIGDLP